MKATVLSKAACVLLALYLSTGLAWAPALTVTNTNDSGSGSLRQVLIDANAIGAPNPISFAIPGSAPFVICPTVPLPTITAPGITLDAQTQPGWTNNPVVQLDGSCQSSGSGITLASYGTLVRGLDVYGFPGDGLTATGGSDHLILGSWFRYNTGQGIFLEGTPNVRIGGTATSTRVWVAGNVGNGILAVESNDLIIWNSYVGTNLTGTAAIANLLDGIQIHLSSGCRIGGPSAAYRVVTSGNARYGFEFVGPQTTDCGFIGSYAGLSASGLAAIPNGRSGGVIFNAPSNFIGGYTAGECSYLSGNARSGLTVDGDHHDGVEWSGIGWAKNNEIRCGYFGTDKTGNAALPNGLRGVLLYKAQFTMVGTVEAGSFVVASGNDGPGIQMIGAVDHSDQNHVAKWNRVHNAMIGVGANGTTPLANVGDGIRMQHSQLNHIGPSNAGNIIRFNTGHGVRSSGTDCTTNSVYGYNTINSNVLNPQTYYASPC